MSTKIEWASEVWNIVTGCTKVSTGCTNCYGERMAKRLAGRFGYPADDPFRVTFHPDKLNQPLKWKKPRNIFVASMGDLFHEDVKEWMLDRIFDRIFYDGISHHKFLILTKRPRNMYDYFKKFDLDIPENVCLGVSVENQQTADERIPILLQIPAKVRFVSVEPMLGQVDLQLTRSDRQIHILKKVKHYPGFEHSGQYDNMISWVICGCESGQNRRPTRTEWIMDLRDQCVNADIPFFLKQMDVGCEVAKMPMLEGKVWNESPIGH